MRTAVQTKMGREEEKIDGGFQQKNGFSDDEDKADDIYICMYQPSQCLNNQIKQSTETRQRGGQTTIIRYYILPLLIIIMMLMVMPLKIVKMFSMKMMMKMNMVTVVTLWYWAE